MATVAGSMMTTATAPALAQWVPADGRPIYGYAPMTARPHANPPSMGTQRDLWRRTRGWCRTRGIGGWIICLPVKSAYSVSIADDSSDVVVPPNSVQNPPAGTV